MGFEIIELLRIVEVFATGFDDLPELIEGRPEYRLLFSTGLRPRATLVKATSK